MSACSALALWTVLAASASAPIAIAAARPFPLPAVAPVATIDVPEEWGPTATGEGVEGAVDNGAVRLSAQYIPVHDVDSALTATMANVRRRGVSPEAGTRRSSARRLNGLDALKVDFSGTDPNGESEITVILIALPAKAGFVAVAYWGDDEAQESVGNDLQAIAESIRPTK